MSRARALIGRVCVCLGVVLVTWRSVGPVPAAAVPLAALSRQGSRVTVGGPISLPEDVINPLVDADRADAVLVGQETSWTATPAGSAGPSLAVPIYRYRAAVAIDRVYKGQVAHGETIYVVWTTARRQTGAPFFSLPSGPCLYYLKRDSNRAFQPLVRYRACLPALANAPIVPTGCPVRQAVKAEMLQVEAHGPPSEAKEVLSSLWTCPEGEDIARGLRDGHETDLSVRAAAAAYLINAYDPGAIAAAVAIMDECRYRPDIVQILHPLAGALYNCYEATGAEMDALARFPDPEVQFSVAETLEDGWEGRFGSAAVYLLQHAVEGETRRMAYDGVERNLVGKMPDWKKYHDDPDGCARECVAWWNAHNSAPPPGPDRAPAGRN